VNKTLCVILLSFFGLSAFAQENIPVWVMVERAERQLEAGEIGDAIRELRRALTITPDNPEALFLLGQAYKAASDYTVALDYFGRALSRREHFVAADRALLVRYEQAEIFRTRREFARYEAELSAILSETEISEGFLPDRVAPIVAREGIDRMLVLYRVNENGGTLARGLLGELLTGLGRFSQASELLSVSVIQSLTTIIEAVQRADPLYEYTTIAALLDAASSYSAIASYVRETTLFHDLYFLGASLLGSPNVGNSDGEQAARDVWETLSRLPDAGDWAGRALRQLEDPQLEPQIVPSR
jgi:tetratricopeptide (TPR) repeat protein